MSKKPASLTSDLLARKGEAEPLSIDPSARMSLFAEPGYTQGGGTERQEEPERPQPPEPEIIYTAEETSSGLGSSRLVIGAVLGAIVVGGVLLVMSNKNERGVAPVSPDMTAENAPATSAPETAPAPEAPAPVTPAPQAMAPEATVPTATAPQAALVPTAPAEQPQAEQPVAPAQTPAAAPESPAPAAAETPAATAPQAAEPATTAPAAPVEEAAPAAAAPKPAKIASGGAWVVQISALRDEKSARAAWSKLTRRFPAVLGGHALNVEKAELGAKGTYYRVRAAGFASKSAAQSACAKLKAGGQDCMVKKR
ncbi:SPOR domain-containing protein [Parvibaculum sp.]|uniref:SPOR domain-containing protein n=1 Tax=Parvibaculum sp. TaxID=2024848 RepID=UPI00320F40BB